MSVRKARVSDAHSISTLVASLAHFNVAEQGTALPEWFSNTLTIQEFERRLTSDKFIQLVYVENQQILAYIAMRGSQHLYHLFVDEAHQGRGLSRLLWEKLKQQCPSETYTVNSSIYAIPIYKKLGFIENGPAGSKEGIDFQAMSYPK